jgi:chemotaxis protein methyltransferase CheR
MLTTISDRDFANYQALLFQQAGIRLGAEKKALLCGRLAKRLRQRGLESYDDYYALIVRQDPAELQTAIDLLTTNETYFFREPKHFEFLSRRLAAGKPSGALRVWSAACSSGEEPYSIAMVLAEVLGDASWEIVATDISTRVLERARTGHYPIERAKGIPQRYLSAYCLKGAGEHAGTFLVEKKLRQRVTFRHLNLLELPSDLGSFDVVFLRNVLIYFDVPTKRQVVESIATRLKPGGHLLIGHSESLHGITDVLAGEGPATYRKP